MKLSERFPALASRDFTIFWVGQFISLIGTWMQNTTQPYLAYRLTGSPLDLGLIAFSATLPTLLLALPGGVIVERLDKRKTVIAMQVVEMIQAFALAALALAGVIQIWHIIVMSFILGTASTIEITARQSMLIELVGKPALPNAIALQSTIFNLARVLGPSLTAVVLLLVSNHGEGWAFFANGVSFLFVIVGLFFVRTPYRTPLAGNEEENPNLAAEFRQGWGYVRGNLIVLLIILMAAWMGFFGYPFGQQIPAVARTMLHQTADTEAAIQTRTSALYLAQGVGALISAVFVSAFSHVRRKGLLMTIGEFVFAAALVLVALTRNIPLVMVMVGVLGWSMVLQMMMMNTLIQLDVPDALRGRVYSVYLWAVQGVAPFGSLFIGWLAQAVGIPQAALVGGILCLAAAIFFHAKWPILRRNIA
ncbi:MAG TPA: MFS transporter [Anaerolineales bacterium]|nr:MFS transporter [Anaerolineales bacterium]